MTKVVLKTHLFDPESGETLTPGTTLDVDKDLAKELIGRGTAVSEEEAAVTEDVDEEVKGEVVEEIQARRQYISEGSGH
jgi:hypothetical protein